jgi:hypothetical protein
MGTLASENQCEPQELELYLRKVATGRGNLAEAARQLRITRATLHMPPKKEGGNYEYGEKHKNKNSPPAEHYVTAHRTPIGGMADSLATM